MASVGAVTRRKGYDVLLAAAARLLDLAWRLTIVGDLGRDAEATARLRQDIAKFGLSDRVRVTGAIPDERLAELNATSDVFVLASRFEGYGMAFAEAIAHGLPVIGAAGGAVPETIPEGAGLLAPPDDPAALAFAMRRLITDDAERQRLAAAARAAAAASTNLGRRLAGVLASPGAIMTDFQPPGWRCENRMTRGRAIERFSTPRSLGGEAKLDYGRRLGLRRRIDGARDRLATASPADVAANRSRFRPA